MKRYIVILEDYTVLQMDEEQFQEENIIDQADSGSITIIIDTHEGKEYLNGTWYEIPSSLEENE